MHGSKPPTPSSALTFVSLTIVSSYISYKIMMFSKALILPRKHQYMTTLFHFGTTNSKNHISSNFGIGSRTVCTLRCVFIVFVPVMGAEPKSHMLSSREASRVQSGGPLRILKRFRSGDIRVEGKRK